jgi:tRNA(Ile2) C34 agmatinyltransferase TiaS
MHKIIEFVLATDPGSLKEKLEQMVNRGWEIKGFVTFHSNPAFDESYAVMENLADAETAKMEEIEEELPEPHETSIYPKSPKKKEVSISMGNN